MTSAAVSLIQSAIMEPCQPWARYVLRWEQWGTLVEMLATEPLTLLAAWADTVQVHALFDDAETGTILPVSVAVEAGTYPALSLRRAEAVWYEHMIHDLWGHRAVGGAEIKPWLDHGNWPITHPMAPRPGPPPRVPEPPEFRVLEGEGMMQYPIGPVAPGIAEASHLRLTLRGDRIVAAEARLGYTHRGTLALMRGKPARTAARFAARLAGDATVAHSMAFALAIEAALGVEIPPRAIALRSLMGALERIATQLDILTSQGALLGAAAIQGRCGLRQEHLRRAMAIAFGHRLMMDCVVPGGVAGDIARGGVAAVRQALDAVAREVPDLRRLYQGPAVSARLCGLGRIRSGPHPVQGDTDARTRARLDAIANDVDIAIRGLDRLPTEGLSVSMPTGSGEGLAQCRSARGEVWHWVRVDHGQVAAIFPRDPGWALWPLAEAALRGAPVADTALICCSLGLPVSGLDL